MAGVPELSGPQAVAPQSTHGNHGVAPTANAPNGGGVLLMLWGKPSPKPVRWPDMVRMAVRRRAVQGPPTAVAMRAVR